MRWYCHHRYDVKLRAEELTWVVVIETKHGEAEMLHPGTYRDLFCQQMYLKKIHLVCFTLMLCRNKVLLHIALTFVVLLFEAWFKYNCLNQLIGFTDFNVTWWRIATLTFFGKNPDTFSDYMVVLRLQMMYLMCYIIFIMLLRETISRYIVADKWVRHWYIHLQANTKLNRHQTIENGFRNCIFASFAIHTDCSFPDATKARSN